MTVTASVLYDLVQCPQRVALDAFGDPSNRNEINPFVRLLWERGTLFEREIISKLQLPFVDLARADAWDINAPPYGDLTVGDQFQKHNYPFGILINAKGERYVDEGANFHSHTSAKYGGEIVRLPGMFAWQVFDAKVSHLLRGEYRIRRVTKAEADTLEELAGKLDGVDPAAFLRTVRAFHAACRTDTPFNPNVLDGRRTQGLAIDKTNWANPLDTPPLHAYHVTTGVTFTFGGLKISLKGEVEDLYGRIIPGLYAAGEMVGGLFFHNYASGTGLMSGATFGRLAGRSAAAVARAALGAA